MKAYKILTGSDNLVCVVLVMCCLGYLAWLWFWAAFILNELAALGWYMKKSTDEKVSEK